MLSALGRMIWVPIAVVLAAMVAISVLMTLGMERIVGAVHRDGGEAAWLFTLLELMRQGRLLSAGLTLIPGLLVIVIGEVARIRSALYYIAGGGIALGVLPLLARAGQATDASGALPATLVWQVFATAGFAGGAAYWLLAGRKA
jgi:hypothetical protein